MSNKRASPMSVSVAFHEKCRQRLSLPASGHSHSAFFTGDTVPNAPRGSERGLAGRLALGPGCDGARSVSARPPELRGRSRGVPPGATLRRRPSFAHSSSRRRPATADGAAGQPDLAECGEALAHRHAPRGGGIASRPRGRLPAPPRGARPRRSRTRRRFAERNSCVPAEHRDDHRQPLRVHPGSDPPRHRQVGGSDQRLDLEE